MWVGECGKNGDFRESPDFFDFHVGKGRGFAVSRRKFFWAGWNRGELLFRLIRYATKIFFGGRDGENIAFREWDAQRGSAPRRVGDHGCKIKKVYSFFLFSFEGRDATGEFCPVIADSLPDQYLYPGKDRYRHHLLPDQGHVLTVIIPD